MKKKAVLFLLLATTLSARKFYTDDPLEHEPKPARVEKANRRKLNDYYDFFHSTFARPGDRQSPGKLIPGGGVNTLGEVPDSAWYQNRHRCKPMTIEELARGPGSENAPSIHGPWKVRSAKTEGITPGFVVEDSRGFLYWLKFDPLANPEMASAADVIGSKFFYALGYNVPEKLRCLLHPRSVAVNTEVGDKRCTR